MAIACIELCELTKRQTDTQNGYCNPRCACVPRVNDNQSNVGKMILKGAYNITEAMKCSMDYHARAMLLLIYAATEG